MSKVYSSEKIAQAVAAKLNAKAEGHTVEKQADGWHVIAPAGTEQATNADQIADGTANNQLQAEVAEEQAAPAPQPTAKVITVEVPGVKETPQFFITDGEFMGKQRWFEKARFPGVEYDSEKRVAKIPMTVAQLKARDGMKKLVA